jgi:choline dehydrogenase-like flavoprotein
VLIDARDLPAGKELQADLCIIGAGAAGITMARELRDSGLDVILLESGGFDLEPEVTDLYKGRTGGTFLPDDGRYLVTSRLRLFGGTTKTWAGFCVPMDPLDMEKRDWVPNSGWPFGREHLDPYYLRAAEVCQVKPHEPDLSRWSGTPRAPLDLGADSGIVTRLVHMSPPTHFGDSYRQDLVDARRVTLCLHANAVDLVPAAAGGALSHVVATSLKNNRFTIKARDFVLAAGGIENPRLLLQSRSVHPQGIGNDHDLVGRYFMEHPHLHVGFVTFTGPTGPLDLYRQHSHDPLLGHNSLGLLCPSPELQRREKILNVSVQLYPAPASRLSEFVRGVGRMAAHTDAGFSRPTGGGGLVSVNLYARVEPSPDPASRVTLGSDRDALGQQRVVLDWRLPRLDSDSLRRTIVAFGRELGRVGKGRLFVRLTDAQPWPSGSLGGDHHMGTTRMSQDSTRGVVDADCRVHGLDNLFVAGSSVYPSAGFANPTLTIIALALRLADHHRTRLAA